LDKKIGSINKGAKLEKHFAILAFEYY